MSCCATTTLVSSNPTSRGSIGMPLARLVVSGGARVPPQSTYRGFFYYVIRLFSGAPKSSPFLAEHCVPAGQSLAYKVAWGGVGGPYGGARPEVGTRGAPAAALVPIFLLN